MTMTPRKVYLDNSATTKVDSKVLEAMLPYFSEEYGNPNSLHAWGREARKGVDHARAQVAQLIGADPKEIIFTGGGSEADNLAIPGAARALEDQAHHIIPSAIEHHALLETEQWLGNHGYEETIPPLGEAVLVDSKELEAAI